MALQLRCMELPVPYDPATAQVDQSNEKLLWTGAAANGALILAMVGFAGGADDQIAALRMITLPAMLGVAGFSFGGAAITHGTARLAQRLLEVNAHAKIALAHHQAAAFKEVFQTPSVDPEVARLLWGSEADKEIHKLLAGRLANAKVSSAKSDATFADGLADLNACATAGNTHLKLAQRWLRASFATAALAVGVLLGQAWTKPPLAAPSPAPTAVATVPASSRSTPAQARANPIASPAHSPQACGGTSGCKSEERHQPTPP